MNEVSFEIKNTFLEEIRWIYKTYPIASTLRTQFNWAEYKLLIAGGSE